MRLTLELWGSDYRRLCEVARCAEDCAFDGLFYGESLTDLDLDCWTVLAGLAAATRRLRLGPVITNLLPGYRSIALLAKQAVTLQDISAGRLEFRTGAGATVEFASPWWAPYGVSYPPHGQRLAALAEGLRALTALWAGECPPRAGGYFALPRCAMRASPVPIPVTIAARHDDSMRLAAELAGTWETSYVSPQEFRALDAKFSALAGPRSPAVVRSVEADLVIASTRRDLDAKLARFAAERRGTGIRRLVRTGLIGLPEEVAARAAAFAAAGVDQLVIAPLDPFDTDALRLLARAFDR